MTTPSDTLGIIAGGGDLPIAIARAARDSGRNVFILALEGMAIEADVSPFPHAFAGLGELGKTIRLLKDAGCTELTLVGKVARPEISKLKLDWRGTTALPQLVAAALKGDDALLRSLVAIFEKEGMRVIGSADAARGLLSTSGPFGKYSPTEQDRNDIRDAAKVVAAMGILDIGQAAVVCHGLVLAVEAAEGTDAMLMRVASLPDAIRGTPGHRRGVLLKAPKPNQEQRVDLPVIGVPTIELAAAAGLSGIAVEASASLIVNRTQVVASADLHGMFLYGYVREDLARE